MGVVVRNVLAAVDHVGFQSIQHLHPVLLPGRVGFGKGLQVAVVGDRNRPVPPLSGLSHVIRNRVGGVHRTHRRVKVQLRALITLRRVLPFFVVDLVNITGHDDQVPQVRVFLHASPDLDPLAGRQVSKLGFVLLTIGELFDDKR